MNLRFGYGVTDWRGVYGGEVGKQIQQEVIVASSAIEGTEFQAKVGMRVLTGTKGVVNVAYQAKTGTVTEAGNHGDAAHGVYILFDDPELNKRFNHEGHVGCAWGSHEHLTDITEIERLEAEVDELKLADARLAFEVWEAMRGVLA